MPRFVRISRCPKIHDFTLTSGERDGTRTRRQERVMSLTNRLPDVASKLPVHPRIPSPSPPRQLTFQPMHLDKWHLWEKIARDNSPSDRPSAKEGETGVSRSSVLTCKQRKLTTKDLLELAPRRVTYIVLGYEVSRSTGRGHVQGFLRTQHPREFSGIKKLLGRGIFSPHIEQSSPSVRSIEYCKKTTNWEEAGSLPDFAKCRSEFKDEEESVSAAIARKRELYAKLKDGAAPSVLIDDQPEEYAFIHSISKYAAASRVRTYAAQVLYIHGTTGLGKTTTTQLCLDQLNIEYYKKAPGCKWFCGYSFQPIILFDEFASAIPLHRFNAMCDPKPPLLEIKGAQIPNASTHYIILSNRSPDDQYRALKTEKPDEWDAYRRRITSSHHIVNTHDDVEAVRADINMIVSLFVSDLLLDL